MEVSGVVELFETDGVEGAQLDPKKAFNQHSARQLSRWLKVRKLKKSGNKNELVMRVLKHLSTGRSHKLWFGCDRGVPLEIKRSKVVQNLGRKVPQKKTTPALQGWKPFPAYDIPSMFNQGHVIHYIKEQSRVNVPSSVVPNTEELYSDCDDTLDAANEVNAQSTMQRAKKHLIASHILQVRDIRSEEMYLLKGELRASYKLQVHYPTATLSVESGSVLEASCSCKLQTLARCTHVAALLLHVCDHVKKHGYGALACTSKPKEWGKGKVERDPGRLIEKNYYTRDFKRRAPFDPRPSECQETGPMSNEYLNKFHTSLQVTEVESVFLKHIPMQYEDFQVGEEDMPLILERISQFYEGFHDFILKGVGYDPILIPGTEPQTDSEMWKIVRCLMFTASIAKEVIHMQSEEAMKSFLMKNLWKMSQEVVTIGIKWGTDHEQQAREAYSQWKCDETGQVVTVEQTGLLVKRECPFLGCSPDGIVREGNSEPFLLEIQCPYSPKDHHPRDFHKVLTPMQLRTFPLKVDNNENIFMNQTHKHFYQIQMAMDVCRMDCCDYFTWTPCGHHTIRVNYDPQFWMPRRNILIKRHGGLLVPEYILQRLPRNLNPVYFNFSMGITEDPITYSDED